MSSTYTCGICKKDFAVESIRYLGEGSKIACIPCAEKAQKEARDRQLDQKYKGASAMPSDGSIKVICVNCRYKFTLKKDAKKKPACPYCGRDKLVEDRTTADKILEEVSRIPDRN